MGKINYALTACEDETHVWAFPEKYHETHYGENVSEEIVKKLILCDERHLSSIEETVRTPTIIGIIRPNLPSPIIIRDMPEEFLEGLFPFTYTKNPFPSSIPKKLHIYS
jgi:hypothetical protein